MIAQLRQDAEPPVATDAERWVVGSMMIDPGCVPAVVKQLSKLDFSVEDHRAVFDAISQRHYNGQPIDAQLVLRDVRAKVGDDSALLLAGLGESVPTAAHADHYASIVRDASLKRRVFFAAADALEGACNGHAGAEVLNNLHAFAEGELRATRAPESIETHRLADFMRIDFRDDFLIDGVITAGQPGVVAAKSKSQKTTVSVAASLAMATGTPFLGDDRWQVREPIECGIISAESGGATLKDGFRRIGEAQDVDPLCVQTLHVGTKVPHLVNQAGRDQLRAFIDDRGLRCLFVDPTYKAFAGVEDTNLAAMAEVLFPISEIVDETGCSIVMVHHNRKTPARQGEHYAEPTIDDIQGTGFQQWARFFLLLAKRREWDANTGQHWLWFKTEGSSGFGSRSFLDIREGLRSDPGGRVWDVELSEPSEGRQREQEEREAARDAEKLDANRRKVCNALAAEPNGMTKSAAMKTAKVSHRVWSQVLETMLDEGDIIECEVTVCNQKTPRPGIKLAPESASQEAA